MSLITYPLNRIEYSAEDAELYNCTRNSGVYAKDDFDYEISGSDNNITINSGIAWIRNSKFSGKVVALKTPETIDLGLPDSVFPRIDSVVIRFSANQNRTNIIVKHGTPATKPVAPTVVRGTDEYELHLYHILRNAGAASVSASSVTDLRIDSKYCGLMGDSITKIDTSKINQQVSSLIQEFREEINSARDESLFVLKSGGEVTGDLTLHMVNVKPKGEGYAPRVNFTDEDGTIRCVLAGGSTHRAYIQNYCEDTDYCEYFYTPKPDEGRTGNVEYSILTSKKPVTLSQGGTGANNDSDARANLKVPRIDLLWTNASPTSVFPAQTLNLGLNNYSMYIILARSYADESNAVCAIGRTGYGVRLNTIGALNTGYHEVRRSVDYVSGGNLKFLDVYRNGAVNSDGYLVPQFIYGIKGVQS